MPIKTEIIATIAGSAMLGGGTMVLNAHRDNSVQEKQIEQLDHRQQSLDDTLKALDQSVRDLDKSVAVLTERISKE